MKRFWDENETRGAWGYGVFYAPGIDEARLEEYRSRRDVVVWNARSSVGFPPSLCMECKLRSLAWPNEDENAVTTSGDDPVETFQHLRKRASLQVVRPGLKAC